MPAGTSTNYRDVDLPPENNETVETSSSGGCEQPERRKLIKSIGQVRPALANHSNSEHCTRQRSANLIHQSKRRS